MADEIKIEGLSDLLRAMQQLPQAIQQKCLRRAMVPGAQVIRNAAQDLVRQKTGLIKRAIRIAYNRQESTPGRAVYHVFVSMKVKKVGTAFISSRRALKKLREAGNQGRIYDAFYWRFLEFGTVKMAAKPFMRPAFDATNHEATATITSKLAELIDKEAAALGKR